MSDTENQIETAPPRKKLKIDHGDSNTVMILDRSDMNFDQIEIKNNLNEIKIDQSEVKVEQNKVKVDQNEVKIDQNVVKIDQNVVKIDRKEVKIDKSENEEDGVSFDDDSASNHSFPENHTKISIKSEEKMSVLSGPQISLQTKVRGPKVTIEKAVLKQESKTSTSSASVSLLKASLLKKVDTKTLSIEACGQKPALKMPPLSSLLKQSVIKPKTNNCTKPKSNIIMNSFG